MAERDRSRIRRAIRALLAQRSILLERLEEINENLRRLPNPSRARRELLAARVSIREALRLNRIAIRLLRSVL
jgi:septal ring factor EnvC (AmiA/AmiB activator)